MTHKTKTFFPLFLPVLLAASCVGGEGAPAPSGGGIHGRADGFGESDETPLGERVAVSGDSGTVAQYLADDEELSDWEMSEHWLFNGRVHKIRLVIDEHTFGRLVDTCDDPDAPYRYVQQIVVEDAEEEGRALVWHNLAIKLRGNTSRCNERKQFRLRFDKATDVYESDGNGSFVHEYSDEVEDAIEDREAFGLTGFSLRSSLNDDTTINELLSSEIMAYGEEVAPTFDRGGSVYRVAQVQLYVATSVDGPGDYKGLYQITEDIGRDFIRQRVDDRDSRGTLVQLNYSAAGRPDFDPEGYNPSIYEVVTHEGRNVDEGEPEWEEANALVRSFLEQAAVAESREELEALLDVDSVINYLVGVKLTGHWDSMYSNYNNDYLYYNRGTGRWQIIVWDLDNSLNTGNEWNDLSDEQETRFTSIIDEAPPMFRRVLAIPELQQRYRDRVRAFVEGYYDFDRINRRITELRDRNLAIMPDWERARYPREKYERIYYFVSRRYHIALEDLAWWADNPVSFDDPM